MRLFILIFILFPTVVHGQHEGVRIAWDYSSLHQIAEQGGYPRMIRLQDSSLFLIYETYTGNIHVRRSKDDGQTWSTPREVFTRFSYSSLDGQTTVVNMSNPEIIQLKNGDIVIACNYRPAQQEIAPYTIVIKKSVDNGSTWLAPQTLYVAAPRFKDGCWEPSFLQLPDGELQVYFANENPYQQSNEQEISMVSSKDNGTTWTKQAKTVSFRKGKRDGMPVPILLNDEIVVAIEDNKTDQFKPYTVRTSIDDNWAFPVLSESPNRNYALEEAVPDSVYMGAPYLLRLPGGETLLSYQTTENRSQNWELSTMEVVIGNKDAKNFGHPTRPFDLDLLQQAKWNSLALWNDKTVVALASTDYKTKRVAPWYIKGHIIPNSVVATSKITHFPIFLGSKTLNYVKAGIAKKGTDLIIACKVSIDTSKENHHLDISIYYTEGAKMYKLRYLGNRNYQLFTAKNREWHPVTGNLFVDQKLRADGYDLELHIPYPAKSDQVQFGLSMKDKFFKEYLVQMDEWKPDTWIKVAFE